MSYSSIFWLPVAAVLTALGLFLTYRYGRPRGNRAMLRGAAWSLIPIAAYLTGSIEMFWKIGTAIGNFASAFVFSPVKWAGIAVAGAAAVLFVSTSGRQRRKASRQKAAERAEQKKAAAGSSATPGLPASNASSASAATSALPATRNPEPARPAPAKQSGRKGAPVDEDMRDIEEILRNRGI
jgi:hypothetical protein